MQQHLLNFPITQDNKLWFKASIRAEEKNRKKGGEIFGGNQKQTSETKIKIPQRKIFNKKKTSQNFYSQIT
jgi:hypothetical protein